MRNMDFGNCTCGGLLVAVYYEEKERIIRSGIPIKTGRTRKAVSHLSCLNCMKNVVVDNSFDEPFKYK